MPTVEATEDPESAALSCVPQGQRAFGSLGFQPVATAVK